MARTILMNEPIEIRVKGHQPFSLKTLGVEAEEILDTLADGVYVTDCDRNILFWNRAAERITGWTKGDVVGNSCFNNILAHLDKDGHRLCGKEYCPLHRAIVTGEASSTPLIVYAQGKNGKRHPAEISVSPIRNEEGHVVGGIEVFRDLTPIMQDLQRAKIIQQDSVESLLPEDPRLLTDIRYRPADLVGGDFYRIERIGEDCYVILLVDVVGHGVASALNAMQLRSIWEELRPKLNSPVAFMGELNDKLFRLPQSEGYYATAVFFVIDLEKETINYTLAGHPTPLIFRPKATVLKLQERSPALGLMPDAPWVEEEVPFMPGDTLLAYTDGAVEVLNGEDQELGEKGFLELVKGELADTGRLRLDEIEEELLRYSSTLRLLDDLTLLSVNRKV